MADFTKTIYYSLLKSLLVAEYDFQPFHEFIEKPQERTMLLRHDVDALPGNSLKTAQIEQRLGIRGIYYFRIVPQSNHPKIIEKISSFDHEIGYHYEDLALCKGNMDEAIKSFEKNLKYFRQLYPVKTICMHGSPLSKYDNRKLWEKYNYRDLGIVAEPYFDVDYTKVLYLTDTGRRWDGESVSVRDKIGIRDQGLGNSRDKGRGTRDEIGIRDQGLGISENKRWVYRDENGILRHNFHSTFDIIKAAEEGRLPDQMMITVHPQRWTNNPVLWTKELIWQGVKNKVKKFVVKRL